MPPTPAWLHEDHTQHRICVIGPTSGARSMTFDLAEFRGKVDLNESQETSTWVTSWAEYTPAAVLGIDIILIAWGEWFSWLFSPRKKHAVIQLSFNDFWLFFITSCIDSIYKTKECILYNIGNSLSRSDRRIEWALRWCLYEDSLNHTNIVIISK